MIKIENLLSDLIKIQTFNPPGNETGVAAYLKRLFEENGIKGEVIEVTPGRGSFVTSIGEGKKSLLYLAHIDVVPAAEGWDFPPYSGDIKDGFVMGRGALDCKGLTAAEAIAVLNLARSNKLKGRLIFAATAGEETGGVVGVKHLVDNFKTKIVADYTLTEGGWEPFKIGGKVCHFLQAGEKGIVRIKLIARGVSAHASKPALGDNAIVKLAGVIKKLGEYKPEIKLIPESIELINEIAHLQGYRSDVMEKNLDRFIKGQEDKNLGAIISSITRMTVSPNVIHGGIKANVIPDYCEADVDIRIVPGQTRETVMRELGPILKDVEVNIYQYNAPTLSTKNTAFYRMAVNTLKEMLGDITVLPCLGTGGTDSRHLRPLGIPCYGTGMLTFDLNPELANSVHGRNEKVDIASLKFKSEYLEKLAVKYLGE